MRLQKCLLYKTSTIQLTRWLLVFGQELTRVRSVPTGQLLYLDFMAPRILVQSVLFIAIFHGIADIWRRDLFIVHKMLANNHREFSILMDFTVLISTTLVLTLIGARLYPRLAT